MAKQEWTTVDKSEWGDGPWQQEPDKVQWQDKATGLPCLAVRNAAGTWCGYVGVSDGHPAYEQHYDNVDVMAHGGLTYSDHCQESEDGCVPPEKLVCHIPQPGEADQVWWLGFDCFHSGDMAPTPYHRSMLCDDGCGDVYRTLPYVKGQCRKLAKQLSTLTPEQVTSTPDGDAYWRSR